MNIISLAGRNDDSKELADSKLQTDILYEAVEKGFLPLNTSLQK
jgi:hypothetical protein